MSTTCCCIYIISKIANSFSHFTSNQHKLVGTTLIFSSTLLSNYLSRDKRQCSSLYKYLFGSTLLQNINLSRVYPDQRRPSYSHLDLSNIYVANLSASPFILYFLYTRKQLVYFVQQLTTTKMSLTILFFQLQAGRLDKIQRYFSKESLKISSAVGSLYFIYYYTLLFKYTLHVCTYTLISLINLSY